MYACISLRLVHGRPLNTRTFFVVYLNIASPFPRSTYSYGKLLTFAAPDQSCLPNFIAVTLERLPTASPILITRNKARLRKETKDKGYEG